MRKNLTKTAAILVMSAMVAASALTACGSKAEETTAALIGQALTEIAYIG